MKCWVASVMGVCWVSGGGVHVSIKSGKYLLKTLKGVRLDVFQLLCREVIDWGNDTGANSSLIQTPSVANCMHRLVVIMAVGMADCIGWGSPRPPCLIDIVAISCEWRGMSLVCVTCSMIMLIISVNSPLKAPSQQNQLFGRPLV